MVRHKTRFFFTPLQLEKYRFVYLKTFTMWLMRYDAALFLHYDPRGGWVSTFPSNEEIILLFHSIFYFIRILPFSQLFQLLYWHVYLVLFN